MELRDLIVTPILIIIVYLIAYKVRPYVTDEINRKYFLPALTVKIIGALALGFIYQFYYGEGDTLAFHAHGSRHIWEAFIDSPQTGMQIFFSPERFDNNTYNYISKIWYYRDVKSFFIIRISFLFDLLTFSSYSATAVLFAVVSFIGGWLLFITFYPYSQRQINWIAFACLFLPSVIFWGSGLLKDTITLAALGATTYCVHCMFINRKVRISHVILLILCIYTLFSVRKFILQAYLPAVFLWVAVSNLKQTNSRAVQFLLIPLISLGVLVGGYFAIIKVGEGDKQYSIEKLALTAKITAYDIRFWTGRDAGSGYFLGELDGSYQSLFSLAPKAINVTLFRPYLWEIKNPLMFVSALESLFILLLTIYFFYKARSNFFESLFSPNVLFCFCFALVFSFAVGVSTYNFGTLARYKIPAIPFYLLSLIMLAHKADEES